MLISTSSIIIALVIGYILTTLFLFLIQVKLVFKPKREIFVTPAAHDLNYNDFEVITEDSEVIRGWYCPCKSPKGLVLFNHGNTGNRSDCIEKIKFFQSLNYSAIVYDYRGYAENKSKITEKGLYRDADAVWKYANSLNYDRIIIYGESLGGGIASYLAVNYQPSCLVLESTFTSITSIAQEKYPFMPVKWLLRYKLDTLSRIKDITTPIMVIHSIDDNEIPFEQAVTNLDQVKSIKKLVPIHGSHDQCVLDSKETVKTFWLQFEENYL